MHIALIHAMSTRLCTTERHAHFPRPCIQYMHGYGSVRERERAAHVTVFCMYVCVYRCIAWKLAAMFTLFTVDVSTVFSWILYNDRGNIRGETSSSWKITGKRRKQTFQPVFVQQSGVVASSNDVRPTCGNLCSVLTSMFSLLRQPEHAATSWHRPRY